MPYISFHTLHRLVNERHWEWWSSPANPWRQLLRNPHGRIFQVSIQCADARQRTLHLERLHPATPRAGAND